MPLPSARSSSGYRTYEERAALAGLTFASKVSGPRAAVGSWLAHLSMGSQLRDSAGIAPGFPNCNALTKRAYALR